MDVFNERIKHAIECAILAEKKAEEENRYVSFEVCSICGSFWREICFQDGPTVDRYTDDLQKIAFVDRQRISIANEFRQVCSLCWMEVGRTGKRKPELLTKAEWKWFMDYVNSGQLKRYILDSGEATTNE